MIVSVRADNEDNAVISRQCIVSAGDYDEIQRIT